MGTHHRSLGYYIVEVKAGETLSPDKRELRLDLFRLVEARLGPRRPHVARTTLLRQTPGNNGSRILAYPVLYGAPAD
jgi:hypothetical protein